MNIIKTIRISGETHSKLKNFSEVNAIFIGDAVESIISFIIANGYTISDLKQLNSDSSFDRIFKRIDDTISILRALERDNFKPLLKQVRYVDENVEKILSNMQIVQNDEIQHANDTTIATSNDLNAIDNFSKDREGKWFIQRAEKGSKICDKLESLFKKLDNRIEFVNNEKRYILNDEIINEIENLKDLVKNF